MLYLVIGGVASGKSEYAESVAVKLSKEEKLYIATMEPFDDECVKKIARHRKMRSEKGFITAECQRNLHLLKTDFHKTAMLECMSNLLANEMYCENPCEDVVDNIIKGIDYLNNQFENLIIVSNNIFSSPQEYDNSTEEYIKNFGLLNRQIALKADNVIEVVCGIPVVLKGGKL